MRKLSEQELKLVQKAIIAKEISVIEVLAEAYDHYISHLEGFAEEEFKSELAKLESKWTYPYCQSLQNDFSKSINKIPTTPVVLLLTKKASKIPTCNNSSRSFSINSCFSKISGSISESWFFSF